MDGRRRSLIWYARARQGHYAANAARAIGMIHLHVHSNHSLLEGVATPRQLVARAVEHGMKSLALTDSAGLYAAIPFYKTAREAGIKPILGAALGGTILLARNREGYAELCRLLTAHHCNDESLLWPWLFQEKLRVSQSFR